MSQTVEMPKQDPSMTFDIVVVGYGYAGAVAAIEAADLGMSVAIFEKMPNPGGISICSGGGIRIADDPEIAFEYLRQTCGGLTPDHVLRAFAQGMTEIKDYMSQLGQINGSELISRVYPGNYPFDGYEKLGFVQFKPQADEDLLSIYPHVRGLRGGARHFHIMEMNIKARGIPVYLNTPAQKLTCGDGGEVDGVEVLLEGKPQLIRANQAVVLACGGFEAAEDLKRQFFQGDNILNAAYLGNTGDGLRMAQDVGASIWHMWHYHGTYGIKHPDKSYPYGIRLARLMDWIPGLPFPQENEMPWIVLDQRGRRYMNEFPPYVQDTGHRPMEFFDTTTMSYPRIPSKMVFDDAGRRRLPLGMPSYNDVNVSLDWSKDNLKEVERGFFFRADSLAELALLLDLEPEVLEESVERWNRQCDAGCDQDFGRPDRSMLKISEPPFYGTSVYPVLSNTQGGPAHDEHWRVLDTRSAPIPGLYEAGELGGIFGHLYLAGGNVAECYIGARRAVRHAASRNRARGG